jgi:hypothetical protein
MKTILLLILTIQSGCATTSAAIHVSGRSPAPIEDRREASLPMPDVTEELAVVVDTSQTLYGTLVSCSVSQRATTKNHVAGTRFGSKWKYATAAFFVAEAAVAAIALSTAEDKPGRYLLGGFAAADALGTFGLFWVPKREVYVETEDTVETAIHDNCPAGLAIVVSGYRLLVNGRGKLSKLGRELLLRELGKPISIELGSRTAQLTLEGGRHGGRLAVTAGALSGL